MVIVVALVSIVVAPWMPSIASRVADVLVRIPFINDAELEEVEGGRQDVGMRRHVVICGYGRVARVLANALERRDIAFVVIDINVATVRELRERGIEAIYGDAGRRAVLEHAGVAAARSIAITVPDLVAATAATRLAREINPTIDIVARASVQGEVFMLRSSGASEVVQPEFEAGLEFTRFVMRRLGVSSRELEVASTRRRARFYQQAADESVYVDDVG
jgi:CPA2 family monovalent cation:H+ antiporter-2